MKDRQNRSAGARPSVPFLSPFLHWLAVPAIVFLRSGFGFSFLRSRVVFLSFAWASVLYLIYSRLEPGAWARNWAVASFAAGAAILYTIHLLWAFAGETLRRGRHDFHSGTSHLLRIPGLRNRFENERFETVVQLWIEPLLVLLAGLTLSGVLGEHRLSGWLRWVAAGMWVKEFINFWYEIRSEKKHGDIMEDAEEKMPETAGCAPVPLPQAGNRKPRTRRPPQAAMQSFEDRQRERRFAEVLRLMPPHPPFDLRQAERHHRDLMAGLNPEGEQDAERAAELDEAIEYFRNV